MGADQEIIETRRDVLGASTDHSGARTDDQLVGLWLASVRSLHTQRAYRYVATHLLAHLAVKGKGLKDATVRDLMAWRETITGSESTARQRVTVAKSLMSFAHKTGYCRFNVGAAMQPPRAPDNTAERILTREEVHRLFAAAADPTHELFTRLLYYTGARVSELCRLRWGEVHWSEEGAVVVTLRGKGGRTRHVRLEPEQARTLEVAALGLPEEASPDAPRESKELDPARAYVFHTRTGAPWGTSWAFRVVQGTARKAGLRRAVSPHWLRHAHASHALDAGAPAHLVQATLGHASLATTTRYAHARPRESSARYLG